MNETVSKYALFQEPRGRVYLLWAILCIFGFGIAHFARYDLGINSFWVVLSFIGLGYMYKVMPMRLEPARRLLLAWAVPIAVAMIVSYAAFYVDALSGLVPYLAAFWLVIMAISYVLNGIIDKPFLWYGVAAGLNVAAAVACYLLPEWQAVQWLIAAIVSGWSMLWLWIFRS